MTRGLRALVIVLALVAVSCILVVTVGTVAEVRIGATVAPGRAGRDETMAWVARGLLLLSALWLLIGIVAARTRLVRRPGAAAARATWIAATRPWRSRESMLGLLPLDRFLMLAVPLGLLIATRAVQTSFLVVWPILLLSSTWAIFVLIAILLVRPRSPWPVIASVGGVVVLHCMVDLIGIAVAGPGMYWLALWANPVLRSVEFTVSFALLAWGVVAAGGALNAQVGARRSTGIVLVAAGSTVALVFAVIGFVGPEHFGTLWEDTVLQVRLAPQLVWLPVALGVAAAAIGGPLARRERVGTRA